MRESSWRSAPGGGVARIDELLLARRALPLVHLLEIRATHEHFAAHLEERRRMARRAA